MNVFFPVFLFCFLVRMSEPEPVCDDVLVTDFSQNDCIKKMTSYASYYYTIDTEICIPYCEKYNVNGYSRKKCPCVPGYACALRCSDDTRQVCTTNADCKNFPNICMKTCVADDRTCMAYYANTTDYNKTVFTAKKFKPSCQNDGLWKAKQCKGGVSGRCMCFDSLGTRLFGEAKYDLSKDMTCACSRRKADLLNSGRSYVSFHCNSLGNYEELQCDSGLCWCVEETTGEPTSPLVPVKAMTKLPCYQVSKTGSQYLRQCDSVTYATAEMVQLLKHHGVVNVNMGTKLCDGDGAYGAFNFSQGIAYCTWRDGTKIEPWQSDSTTDINSLNCNCARDFKRYGNTPTCLPNGNYQPDQSVIKNMLNYYYCVDDDGFQKTDLMTDRLANCTLYY